MYNRRKHKGESIRVFPIRNWTELGHLQTSTAPTSDRAADFARASRGRSARHTHHGGDDRMRCSRARAELKKSFPHLGSIRDRAIESTADTLPAISRISAPPAPKQAGLDHDQSASMERRSRRVFLMAHISI